jgi:hypothetical protein
VDGSAPNHPWTRTVKELYHAIPVFEAATFFVPFEHLLLLQGPCPQFIQPDRKIREPISWTSSPAIEDHLALAVQGEAVCQSSCGGHLLCCQRDLAQYLRKAAADPATRDLRRARDPIRTLDHLHESHLTSSSHLQVGIQDPGGFHECLQKHVR